MFDWRLSRAATCYVGLAGARYALASAILESLEMSKAVKEAGEGDIERIRSRIERLVSERFAEGKSVYYLSQLGIDLNEDRKILERLSKMKLADFVKTKFDFELGQTGTHKNVLYIRNPAMPESTTPAHVPRFNNRFWAAFARPLSGATSRFINLSNFDFGPDQNEIARNGGETREVNKKYITEGGRYSTPNEIYSRIKEWLAEQKILEAQFISDRGRSSYSEHGETFLDVLLNTLTGDQLKRVNLPLDVVKALRERRTG